MKLRMRKVVFWQKTILLVLFLSLIAFFLLTATEGDFLSAQSVASIHEESPIADTYVAAGRPDSQPSPPNFRIVWLGHNQTDGFGIEHALFKFDISTEEIPIGSAIQSARLLLTLSGTTTNDSPMNVTVHRILTDQWAENLTWNDHLLLSVASTNAATIPVSRDFQQYEWNLQGMVQEWANSSTRIGLSLRLDSNQTSGDHERNFWSKDCNDSECSAAQRPKLVIQFEPPPTPTATSTPTTTPTTTPIPTSPPTPTPGFEVLKLEVEPSGEITVGVQLHYIVSFKTNKSGAFEFTNVIITDTIPAHTKLITDSLVATSNFTFTYSGVNSGDVITWTRDVPLPQDESGIVSYRVMLTNTSPTISAAVNQAFIEEELVIENDGVDMSWTYNGKREHKHSNNTRTPPLYLYLPVAGKNLTVAEQK